MQISVDFVCPESHAMTAKIAKKVDLTVSFGIVARFSFTFRMEEETKMKCAGWMWMMDLLLWQPCENWA